MISFFKSQKYRHLNKVLISKSALNYNHHQLQKFHPEARISPVLKSNAYGHGLKITAPVFDSFSPPFLIVDSLYEAYQLYSLRLKTPILILGYTHPNNYLVKSLPFHFTIFDIESAQALNQKQKNCPIHLFVDTGMHREGIPLVELDSFVKEVKELKNLRIVGLASHFADADNPNNDSFTIKQLEEYKKALVVLESNQIIPEWRHISASGGAYKVKDDTFNMVRAGLASYGLNPLEATDNDFKKIKLKPALSFTSTLAQIKNLNKGDSVGYNCTFTAPRRMTIGIVPAGYYDGVDRRLSGVGSVLVRGQECPILGRVSMNITVIDLSQVKKAAVGDEVVIISKFLKHKNNLVGLAKKCKTIPYELMVSLAESLRREVVE